MKIMVLGASFWYQAWSDGLHSFIASLVNWPVGIVPLASHRPPVVGNGSMLGAESGAPQSGIIYPRRSPGPDMPGLIGDLQPTVYSGVFWQTGI
jgi:hypothetical protein